jgi:hypothetical protein
MNWTAEFFGRENGAIGEPSPHCVEIEGDTHREAVLKIYETHECIFALRMTNACGVFEGQEGWQIESYDV